MIKSRTIKRSGVNTIHRISTATYKKRLPFTLHEEEGTFAAQRQRLHNTHAALAFLAHLGPQTPDPTLFFSAVYLHLDSAAAPHLRRVTRTPSLSSVTSNSAQANCTSSASSGTSRSLRHAEARMLPDFNARRSRTRKDGTATATRTAVGNPKTVDQLVGGASA